MAGSLHWAMVVGTAKRLRAATTGIWAGAILSHQTVNIYETCKERSILEFVSAYSLALIELKYDRN